MIEGHGDDIYKYGAVRSNFSSNIYSHADLSGLKAHLAGRLDLIGSYPEPEPFTLERVLAESLSVPAANVMVTSGATEAIYLIAQTFRGTDAAVFQPTFSEYADACTMNGCRTVSLYQLPDARADYRLPHDVRMCWICNPNNPTGLVLDKDYVYSLVSANPEVLFVFDQSYEDFTLRPLLSAAEALQADNVILLHSMTKKYCVPGLRLGYITASVDLLTRIRSHRMPWSVNALAIEAGLYLTEHGISGLPDLCSHLLEAQRLRSDLNALGALDAWSSDTHFMLVQLRMGRASALKDYLARKHGILIRDASNFDGLDSRFFRIAAQDPVEDDALVSAVTRWLME